MPTGIEGLDDVLAGGFPPDRLYLIEGDPGTGKTTLALQYLLEGARRGEAGLYITLSETSEELREVAKSHGWSLDALALHELSTPEELAMAEETIFHPSEVELGETVRAITEHVSRVKPARVVFDSLSEMRLLAQNPLRFRRQILALKQFFIGRQATVLLLDDLVQVNGDAQLRSLAHGVLKLEQLFPEYGKERRRLRIVKMRGREYRGGYHDFVIRKGGLAIFPRLISAEYEQQFTPGVLASGVPELDALVGGGLDRGTSTLVMGPAGAGKSVLSTQYAAAAARRGEAVAFFTFEEGLGTMFARAESLGMGLQEHVQSGRVTVQKVDPAELSPGEFAYRVHQAVEQRQARVVVIDSLNGYLNAMPEEQLLTPQLHELLAYLGHRGVATLLVMGQHGFLGSGMQSPVDVSYLADTVILIRYFEAMGRVRRAISLIKRRGGAYEETIREYRIEPDGIRIGPPLEEFQGVLTGVPLYQGAAGTLLAGPKGEKET
ncbi:MAG TPA: ATPase domain-containing protein [Thermoanaerobaculia bacterium]|nr:ATPase domain-containing protein [Thermoanaerobaculia bacterium]